MIFLLAEENLTNVWLQNFHEALNYFMNYSRTWKNFFVTVPVALEEFADDLDTETKEEVDNQELAKGNGMHEINHSKRNIICIFLILQFTSLIVSRKKLITAQITFLLARRLAPLCWAN